MRDSIIDFLCYFKQKGLIDMFLDKVCINLQEDMQI